MKIWKLLYTSHDNRAGLVLYFHELNHFLMKIQNKINNHKCGMSLILSDSFFTILFSENPLGISEKTLKFSVVSVIVTENSSDFSLIVNGFSLN